MSRAKQKYQKRPFESTGGKSDIFAGIYMSMVLSKAWYDLTANQQRLYVYCKLQFYGQKQKPLNDDLCFTMNQSKWSYTIDKDTGQKCGLYRLYSRSNARSFYADMQALVTHGFIKCVQHGGNGSFKSVFRFSDEWQRYGTPEFSVAPGEMLQTKKVKEANVQNGNLY